MSGFNKKKNNVGLWQQIPSSTVSEILCQTDLDFIVLDTEHGVFNDETLFQCIQVITLSGKSCFVRLTEANLTKTRYCLDAGVDGVIFSTVDSLEYLGEIEKQCLFPSQSHFGKRGYGLTRDNMWGEKDRKGKRIIVAQLENRKGVDLFSYNDDGETPIKDFPFIDYFLVGPYDLSSSVGCPGNFEHANFKRQIEIINKIVPKSKLGYHVVKDVDHAYLDLKDCGFLALGMDTMFLFDGIRKLEEIIS